jgi:sirohydrochlorin cobaltochelatase
VTVPEPTTLFDAVVLLAHGSSDPGWRRSVEALRGLLAARAPSGLEIAVAYLRHGEPTLADALAGLERRGVRRALVTPVLLSGGGHLLRDVPEQIRAATEGLPPGRLEVSCAPPLGEEAEVLEAMARSCLRRAGALS